MEDLNAHDWVNILTDSIEYDLELFIESIIACSEYIVKNANHLRLEFHVLQFLTFKNTGENFHDISTIDDSKTCCTRALSENLQVSQDNSKKVLVSDLSN